MKKSSAFTLIEIVVTLAIISVLLFASVPVFSGFLGALEMKGSARSIVADLRFAQEKAVTLRTTVTTYFKPKTLLGEPATYVVKSGSAASGKEKILKQVKFGSKFDFAEPVTIVFSKGGSPPAGGAGTVKLEYIGGRLMRIIISSAGRVRME